MIRTDGRIGMGLTAVLAAACALVREAAATTVYITHDQAEAFALAGQVGVLQAGRLIQAGTPEDIYTRPATPFVARFTALAGELPVRIRDRDPDGTALVEPPHGRPSRAPAGLHPGQTALVMIRPTGIKRCPGGSASHHLTSQVTDVAFRGRGHEHAIGITGTTRLTGAYADTKAPRGQTVALRMDPAGCHLFPAEQ